MEGPFCTPVGRAWADSATYAQANTPTRNENFRFMRPLTFGKNHGHRRASLQDGPRRRETAGLLIDSEDDDRAGVLIAGDEKAAGRVDRETARRLALRRDAAGGRQRPSGRVDAEDRDAVVAAIRGV